jgi:hypothetical protein
VSVLVSVDPGLRHCGVAVFEDGILVNAGLVKNPEKTGRGVNVWRSMSGAVASFVNRQGDVESVALEVMQVYGGPRGEDPNDLLELNAIQGAVLGVLEPWGPCGSYLPRQWKGQIDKTIMCRRIVKPGRLSDQELTNAGLTRCPIVKKTDLGVTHREVSDSLLHNVIDGIGIGLYHLKRLGA